MRPLILSHTSLHKGHPTLRTASITAPFSLHSSLALTSRLVPSSRLRTAPSSLARVNGRRLGTPHEVFASKKAAPIAAAADPRNTLLKDHIDQRMTASESMRDPPGDRELEL